MNPSFSQNKNNSSKKQVKNSKKDKIKEEPLELFPISGKKVEISFTGEKISSNGGALLLKEIEEEIGIIKAMTLSINDPRDQRYVHHKLIDLLKQRIFQIACAYEDANDCDSLKNDPIFKICLDKLSDSDPDLASQPTMSRIENTSNRGDLYRIAEAFINNFIKSYDKEPELIVLDFDDTNNNAHGKQELIEFNGYYGEYCYMPLHVYEGISGKLITTIIKPGKRSKGMQVLAILKRIIKLIRLHWKNTRIVYRGDGHFTAPEIIEWIDAHEKLHRVTGLAGNSRLKEHIETSLKSAKNIYKNRKAYNLGNKTVKLYHTFYYKAESWEKEQRIVAKVEFGEDGSNIRYIVSDMNKCRAKQLYEEIYCARGQMELFIKEHKTYLKSDRSSCEKFEANQFRLFLHSAAYVLLHALQNSALKNTEFANSTMQTIQLKLIKTAAIVKELKTKIKIEFPRSSPQKDVFKWAFGFFDALRC